MWGWSYYMNESLETIKVFPMYVGVILIFLVKVSWTYGVPHVCGGDPTLGKRDTKVLTCSPCMWGWSYSS